MQRPYGLTVTLTDFGEWRAEVRELPGCVAFGTTRDEAMLALEAARSVWLETAIENGLTIPEPRVLHDEPSGRVTLRIPRALHARLADLADEQGASLNQIMLYLLSRGVGEGAGRLQVRNPSSVADRASADTYRP